MLTKKQVRAVIRERLSALTSEQRKSRSDLIADSLFHSQEYLSARSIFVYRSTEEEADTSLILEDALRAGKTLYLPRIEGENMALVPYERGDELAPNEYGIFEPTGEGVAADPDLALIPLVSFDRKLHRLGRGKGYYDRFLACFHGKSIALAFHEQEYADIPVQEFDRKVDAVITDKERIQ